MFVYNALQLFLGKRSVFNFSVGENRARYTTVSGK